MEPIDEPSADDGAEHQPAVESPVESFPADAIERDLADVEVALARLDAGSYWTDEVTGQPLPDDLLSLRPTARRA